MPGSGQRDYFVRLLSKELEPVWLEEQQAIMRGRHGVAQALEERLPSMRAACSSSAGR
jgi:hypothetical protein